MEQNEEIKRLKPLNDFIFMDPAIKSVEERLEWLSSDPQTIALYRAREDSLHERVNMITSAEERGREEGIKEGEVAGITKVAFKPFIIRDSSLDN
jgi:hypothetical protein